MDGSDAGWLCVFIVICVLLNAFFSALETALTESRKSRLEKMADDGSKDAEAALAILERPDDALALSQAGITLMSILAGLAAGTLGLPLLCDEMDFLAEPRPLAFAVTAVLLTGFMLIAGEFLPKKVAGQDPEKMLLSYHGKLAFLTKLARPWLNLLGKISGGILLVVGVNPQVDDTVTEDEVKDLIEQGTEEGTFEKTEQVMVDRIFRLSDQTAYSLMTPRTQMLWLDLGDSLRENLRLVRRHPQTVFAVGQGSLDDFRGVLRAKDLLDAVLEQRKFTPDIESLLQKPIFVPRSMETFRLLQKFKTTGCSEAVVQDEYGGVVGFITLTDIMNAVLNRHGDGNETDNGQIVSRDENSWLVAGLCSIDDFKEFFDLDELPDENRDHFQTMGGFLTSYFGYIPQTGEKREWNGFTFTVMAMDRARIDKILVAVGNKT